MKESPPVLSTFIDRRTDPQDRIPIFQRFAYGLGGLVNNPLGAGIGADVLRRLDRHYNAIRDGLGFRKTARAYGAFPTDPYSHSPARAGAQQPGMTGQVKEEILTRRGEPGVWVRDGCVMFFPIHACLQRELSFTDNVFEAIDLNGIVETFIETAEKQTVPTDQIPITRTNVRPRNTLKI